MLTKITEIITNNVASTFQTFVESLKKEKKFDLNAQAQALRKTKESIFNELSDEAIQYIDNNFGDFNEWITTQIEATIYKMKK